MPFRFIVDIKLTTFDSKSNVTLYREILNDIDLMDTVPRVNGVDFGGHQTRLTDEYSYKQSHISHTQQKLWVYKARDQNEWKSMVALLDTYDGTLLDESSYFYFYKQDKLPDYPWYYSKKRKQLEEDRLKEEFHTKKYELQNEIIRAYDERFSEERLSEDKLKVTSDYEIDVKELLASGWKEMDKLTS